MVCIVIHGFPHWFLYRIIASIVSTFVYSRGKCRARELDFGAISLAIQDIETRKNGGCGNRTQDLGNSSCRNYNQERSMPHQSDCHWPGIDRSPLTIDNLPPIAHHRPYGPFICYPPIPNTQEHPPRNVRNWERLGLFGVCSGG